MALRRLLILVVCVGIGGQLGAQQPAAHPVANWIRSAVIYEIDTRTFSAEGNFRGIEKRLPDLQQLGVTILWLMPIHPIGEKGRKGTLGSPYAVRDYYAIDPTYGTASDLKHLVSAAHQRGMKVIIDIVANHTAWDSVLMKHPDWYHHDATGKIISPEKDWTDVAWLDYSNPELRRYMLDVLKYWLRDFDLDGFRCDVAGMVPTDFWEAARTELTTIKPDIVMIAEANKPELLVKAFDLDYAWPFHSTLTNVAEYGMPASRLAENWIEEKQKFPPGALEMRFSDNHDEKRAIARFGERGALAASALVFTMDGVPMLYNGMEVGDTTESGAPALFYDLPVFWPISERRSEFPSFYHQIIALRKAHPALQQGETEWLRNSAPDSVVTFVRRGPGEQYLIAVNLSNREFSGTVQGVSGEFTDETPSQCIECLQRLIQLPKLSLGAWEFRILRLKKYHPE